MASPDMSTGDDLLIQKLLAGIFGRGGGGDAAASTQPADNFVMATSANPAPSPAPPEQAPIKSKLGALRQLMNGGGQDFVSQDSQNPAPPAGPQIGGPSLGSMLLPDTSGLLDGGAVPVPRQSLSKQYEQSRQPISDILAGASAPGVIPGTSPAPLPGGIVNPPAGEGQTHATFQEAHPHLAAFLKGALNFVQNAGPGIGAPTFGQGFSTAEAQPGVRAERALDVAGKQAAIGKTQAETRALLNPMVKPGQPTAIKDASGKIVGFDDGRGNVLSKDDPRLTASMKQIIDGSQGKIPASPKAAVFQSFKAQGMTDAEAFQAVENLSQFRHNVFKPARMPDGSLGVGVFSNDGKLLRYADSALLPASYYEQIRHGQSFQTDANGNLVSIGTTSTSGRAIPGGSAGTLQAGTEAPGAQSPIAALLSGSGKQSATAPAGAPAGNRATAPAPRATGGTSAGGGINARPVMVNGQPFQKAAAAEMGTAVDPETNKYYLTTRGDAATKGYTNFTKETGPAVEQMKGDNRRLVDINNKVTKYVQGFDESKPLSAGDSYIIQNLLADDSMSHGIAGEGIQAAMGQISKWIDAAPPAVRARMQGNLSEAGAQRYIDYINAREALTGFQKLLTNQGRSSDKVLDLQLQSLPSPVSDEHFGAQTGAAFINQLHNVSEARPVIPGMTNPQGILDSHDSEVRRRNYAAQQNNQAAAKQQSQTIEESDFNRMQRQGQIGSVQDLGGGAVRVMGKDGKPLGVWKTDYSPAYLNGLVNRQ